MNPRKGRRTILIADAEERARAALSRLLLMNGYAVAEEVDGRELFRHLLSGATLPDLILLALEMPRVPGLRALRLLRGTAAFAQIPVIVLSAGSPPPLAEDVPCLPKPVPGRTLLQTIRMALGER